MTATKPQHSKHGLPDYDAMLREIHNPRHDPDYSKGLSRAEWQIVWGKKQARTSELLRENVNSGEMETNTDLRPRNNNGWHKTVVYRPKAKWNSRQMRAAVKKLQSSIEAG